MATARWPARYVTGYISLVVIIRQSNVRSAQTACGIPNIYPKGANKGKWLPQRGLTNGRAALSCWQQSSSSGSFGSKLIGRQGLQSVSQPTRTLDDEFRLEEPPSNIIISHHRKVDAAYPASAWRSKTCRAKPITTIELRSYRLQGDRIGARHPPLKRKRSPPHPVWDGLSLSRGASSLQL